MIHVRPARRGDLPAIERMLTDADLPTTGVFDHLDGFVVAEDENAIVGCAGLETYGNGGLLRSVAVREDYRGKTIGQRLVQRTLGRARTSGVRSVYLLTTSAAAYFKRIGFEEIERSQVHRAVAQSQEFTTGCCDSATAMRLVLRGEGAADDPR